MNVIWCTKNTRTCSGYFIKKIITGLRSVWLIVCLNLRCLCHITAASLHSQRFCVHRNTPLLLRNGMGAFSNVWVVRDSKISALSRLSINHHCCCLWCSSPWPSDLSSVLHRLGERGQNFVRVQSLVNCWMSLKVFHDDLKLNTTNFKACVSSTYMYACRRCLNQCSISLLYFRRF